MNDTHYEAMQDGELAILAKTDEDALSFLLLKYKNFVRSRARSYFLMGADSDDLLQEGMIGLYKAIRDYEESLSSFIGFADLCVTRQIISAVKSATRQKHIPLNRSISLNKAVGRDDDSRELLEITTSGEKDDPEAIIMGNEAHADLVLYIGRELSVMEQKVFNLYLNGLTYADMAKCLNKPEKSIDNALQRIKNKLQAFLRQS